MKRAAELLQGGAVMDRLLQPHESHTNYVLQFMMDYNIQGMNTVSVVLDDSDTFSFSFITPPDKSEPRPLQKRKAA